MKNDFIPVLCCSASKTKEFFCDNGKRIKFVASPKDAPPENGIEYCKPSDQIPGANKNKTWNDLVLEQKHSDFIEAYKLYSDDVYRGLFREYGNNFYILSAGWGIIRACFKIPAYDITYSKAGNMPKWVKRNDNAGWLDINHLKEDAAKSPSTPIILFAGVDYVPHFQRMACGIKNRKIIMYRSKKVEQLPGFEYVYYETRKKIWPPQAAKEFLHGTLEIPQ